MVLKAKIIIFLLVFILTFFALSFKSADKNPTPYTLVYDTTYFGTPNSPTDNPLTVEGVQLGRLLFYDSILSENNIQSCGSCHKQEFAFTDGGKQLSKGARGHLGKRNTMALVNLAWVKYYFWDARTATLEDVVLFPITDSLEMAQDTVALVKKLTAHNYYPAFYKRAFGTNKITFKNTARALAQFVRTIVSRPLPVLVNENATRYSKQTGLPATEAKATFGRLNNNCGVCHFNQYTKVGEMVNNFIAPADSESFFRVTKNPRDLGKFKIPTLINIKATAPYMHNGQLGTAEEVISHYRKSLKDIYTYNDDFDKSELDTLLNLQDIKNIDAFFSLFTDTVITTSKAYSNPFDSKRFYWKDFPYFK